MPTTPARIGVVGEALIDFIEEGDDEPRLAYPGGGPYNVAIGLARLDRHAVFLGRFSQDPLGFVLRRHAERSGVDLSLAIDAYEPTTVALIELEDGIAHYRFGVEGTANFQFTDAELTRAIEPAAGLTAMHFGSLTSWTPPGDGAVARMITAARDRMFVSYDPNVRPHLQPDPAQARDQVTSAIGLAHLVKTSQDDVAYLYAGRDPDDVAQEWLALGPAAVVITRGGDGATITTARGRVHRPVERIGIVDTVGAGDAFMSGLLDALAERDLLDAGRLAAASDDTLGAALDHSSVIAAITCSRAGANPPRRAELSVPAR